MPANILASCLIIILNYNGMSNLHAKVVQCSCIWVEASGQKVGMTVDGLVKLTMWQVDLSSCYSL